MHTENVYNMYWQNCHLSQISQFFCKIGRENTNMIVFCFMPSSQEF